ncbi:hypothetical protein [Burkholderia gladioli]|uniref:hypothetical protein n=1 Tax=Burkholderia gladioli TaxID=28095 RepID=UPI001FC7DD1D|nr:hypothetical protein [Burkholderia gladioli]
MAADWIKMRTNLWDDPRVSRLCEITDQGEASIIGGLYWLWSTVDEHSTDGVLVGMGLKTLDRKTGVPKLGEALVAIGWLEECPTGIRVVRFDEHNGASAKNRAQTAKRVAKHSGKADSPMPSNAALTHDKRNANGDSVSEPLVVRYQEVDIEVDSKQPPIPPKGGDGPEETGTGEPPEATGVGKPARRAAIALKTFLADCRQVGEKPIPESDPVFDYAEKTGIPLDVLRLHWLEFKARYSLPDAKRYKDWRTVYRKSVRGNWFRLWFLRPDGAFGLTTQGEQAKREHNLEAA